MISVGGLAVEYLACRARCRGYRAGNKDEITNIPGFCSRGVIGARLKFFLS